jgi:hypothetical protein
VRAGRAAAVTVDAVSERLLATALVRRLMRGLANIPNCDAHTRAWRVSSMAADGVVGEQHTHVRGG